ncbi:glycosyltransferase family 1 protein [Enterococcus avium]|uniref:glycosyltransferase family 1 protein n=2 Tax=Enterococcus avium TaxID=33945 RepID=UPI00209E8AB5|nr:glycosyltransferase family 1 protein [Enterococcus avium]
MGVNMEKARRVLHFQGRMGKGGAESFMMNLYRKIDKEKLQFDFLIYDDYANVTDYHNEIKKMGGRIFVVTNPKKNIFKYLKQVNALLRSEKFDIAHNEVYFGGGINLYAAKRNGIKQRIAHSHATSDGKSNNLIMKVLKWFLHKLLMANATDFLAVSKEAGDSLFGSHTYRIIHNGIDMDKYKTNEEVRNSKRAELGIAPTSLVIGNIGRLEKQKNQKYLLNIFFLLLRSHEDARLLIVGSGSLKNELIEKIENLGLGDKVLLLDERDDIPELFQAMDVFCMTSLYEGLPMVGLEAQASQKKLVLSDTISPDIKLTDNVTFVSLDENYQTWIDNLLRKPYTNEITAELKQYDVSYTLKQMMSIYLESEKHYV